jgi:putative hemolysin
LNLAARRSSPASFLQSARARASGLDREVRRLLSSLTPLRPPPEPRTPSETIEIVPAIAPTLLKAEVEALPKEQHLVCSGPYTVVYARAAQIPWCLQEIGRLRELTFRAVGEGTGKASDIDLYDAYYLHLFIWDSEAGMIVGAYRLGLVDEIHAHFGKRGLYTQSLFAYSTRFLNILGPAIELGRSFVRAEYQRSYAPLMLLWRGIGRFILRSPKYAVLFGPVSISNRYAAVSRELMVEFLSTNNMEASVARYVKPRRPFRGRRPTKWDGVDSASLKSIEDLSRAIERIEVDQKGVPILLKQYLKLGGRLLCFSSDKAFNDALDGLTMIDLRNSDPRMLSRYMGEDGVAAFLGYHGAPAWPLRQAS